MVFGQLVMLVRLCTAVPRQRHASSQHCTGMTNWPNTIQCLGSDDIMSLGIKSSATEGFGPCFSSLGAWYQHLEICAKPDFWKSGDLDFQKFGIQKPIVSPEIHHEFPNTNLVPTPSVAKDLMPRDIMSSSALAQMT